MKQWTILATVASIALAATFSANAQTTLTEVLVNEDGTSYDQLPNTASPISVPNVTTSGFGASTVSDNITPPGGAPYYLGGLGTLQYTVTGAGAHYFDAMVDDEADFANGPFHDSGSVSGSAPAGVTWEIGFPGASGLIGGNTTANTLDDANDVPGGNTDIAVALGFNFTLAAGQTATIDINASSTAPASGFYLQQWNTLDSDPYFTESLTISGSNPGGGGVPDDGATWFSMLLGLTGLAAATKFDRKFSRSNV